MKNILQASVCALWILCAASNGFGATMFTTTLSGTNEVPPTTSTGTGNASVTLVGNTLDVTISFSGLSSGTTAGHIHCCAALGTNANIAVPFATLQTGVTSGTLTAAYDLTNASVYSAAFLADVGGTAALAETALLAGLNADQAYANIHTTTNPGGEIRGQLMPVPEPATFVVVGTLLGFAVLTRRRRQRG